MTFHGLGYALYEWRAFGQPLVSLDCAFLYLYSYVYILVFLHWYYYMLKLFLWIYASWLCNFCCFVSYLTACNWLVVTFGRITERENVQREGRSDAQASRGSETTCPPGQRTQVHGDIFQTADILFHLPRVHLVSHRRVLWNCLWNWSLTKFTVDGCLIILVLFFRFMLWLFVEWWEEYVDKNLLHLCLKILICKRCSKRF